MSILQPQGQTPPLGQNDPYPCNKTDLLDQYQRTIRVIDDLKRANDKAGIDYSVSTIDDVSMRPIKRQTSINDLYIEIDPEEWPDYVHRLNFWESITNEAESPITLSALQMMGKVRSEEANLMRNDLPSRKITLLQRKKTMDGREFIIRSEHWEGYTLEGIVKTAAISIGTWINPSYTVVEHPNAAKRGRPARVYRIQRPKWEDIPGKVEYTDPYTPEKVESYIKWGIKPDQIIGKDYSFILVKEGESLNYATKDANEFIHTEFEQLWRKCSTPAVTKIDVKDIMNSMQEEANKQADRNLRHILLTSVISKLPKDNVIIWKE
jgi:hypothetical protein